MDQKAKIKLNGNNFGKVPPQAVELEEIIIGTLLIEPNSIDRIENILLPEHFYNDNLSKLYKTILNMYVNQIKIDLYTVQNELRKNNLLEQIGGPYYLAQAMNKVASSSHIEEHARIVFQQFLRREVIRISDETLNKGFDETLDVEELLSITNKNIEKLNDISSGINDNNSMISIVRKCVNQLEQRVSNFKNKIINGVDTGISTLNEIIHAWQNQKLIIIAGRPGMGKTALMIHFAKIASKQDIPSAIFSLEMGAEELVDRIIIGECEIRSSKYEKGDLTPQDFANLESKLAYLESLKITIDDTPSISFRELRSKARRLKKLGKLKIMFIDYLQLMETWDMKAESREREIANLTRNLKKLSKELDVPIILLGQLSRKVEERSNKQPQLSDLRESGAIEQDADIVIFPYLPEYYNLKDELGNIIKGEGKLIVAKHRKGKRGEAKFFYNSSMTRFNCEQTEIPF